MLGGIRQRHLGLLGERLHVPGGLGQEIEQLEPLLARDCGSEPRELGVDLVLEHPVRHGTHRTLRISSHQVFNSTLDNLKMKGIRCGLTEERRKEWPAWKIF